MAKFEFRDNFITFEFPGGIIKKIPHTKAFRDSMAKCAEMLLNVDDGKNEDEITDMMMDIIDMLLQEEGVSDLIFEAVEREPNLHDCADIIAYIKEEALGFVNRSVNKYPTTGAPAKEEPVVLNRAQRRALMHNQG